jgi:phytoene dehydrogenase-like protein
LLALWRGRHDLAALVHFRATVGAYTAAHIKSPRLRALLLRVMDRDVPMLFLLMVLGYLSRGWLSRPIGGTAAFRDALVDHYASLGGRALLDTTVEEVVVSRDRAVGVRLTDGTILNADVVVSTSSAPETVFRLLAGRFGAAEWRKRVDAWRMFQPVVLASYGVEKTFEREPSTLLVDAIDPLDVGGAFAEHLYLRIFNEDPVFAPTGHTVVQAMLGSQYDWWATRGTAYQHEKDAVAERILAAIDRQLHGVKAGLRMTDLATPLTYWRSARAWRGAFEGWMPSSSVFTHVAKTLPGLANFYMAGQWVEPGGGVPMATMSGRHVVEIICAAEHRPFDVPRVAANVG